MNEGKKYMRNGRKVLVIELGTQYATKYQALSIDEKNGFHLAAPASVLRRRNTRDEAQRDLDAFAKRMKLEVVK